MADIGGDKPVTQSILAAFRRSRVDGLVATRDYIAQQLDDGVPPRDSASLTKRIADLAQEIEKLQGNELEGAGEHVADQAFRPEAV